MTRKEAKSCIGTIELLQRLAYNIHGVMDVIDAGNCKKIIEALKKEPRWIPVIERLPDKSGRYLVSYNSGYVAMALYYESVSKWGATTTERIVAWMPLPQSYKAESEDGNEQKKMG